MTETLAPTVHYTGKSLTRAKQLCSLKRRRGEARTVVFDEPVSDRSNPARMVSVPVHVNPDDTLLVEVEVGMLEIDVQTGYAEIHPRSRWGNVVRVRTGASAHIVVPGAYKLTLTVEDGADVKITTERENRIFVSRSGNGTGARRGTNVEGDSMFTYVDGDPTLATRA